MSKVFLNGPMAWPPLLSVVVGRDVRTINATLTGAELHYETTDCFAYLRLGEGESAGSVIDDLSPDEAARLDYFNAGLGNVATAHQAVMEGQMVPVTAYLSILPGPESAQVWQIETWKEKWGEIACFAAEEVVQHFPQVPEDVLARMMPMILVRASARVAASKGAPTEVRSQLSANSIEVLEHHIRHAGFFLTREYTLRHPEFGGGMSVPVKREVFVATDAAIVLPYDPRRDRVLLVEQFRMGPFGRGDPHPWMLEPVAGRVDPGEPPQETARRECVEEAGLKLSRLEHISSHHCSPGCSTEYFHCYLGLCELPDLTRGRGGLDSEDEDIRTHVLSFERAMDLIPSGEAANGPLVLCLLWLERERERLRAGA